MKNINIVNCSNIVIERQMSITLKDSQPQVLCFYNSHVCYKKPSSYAMKVWGLSDCFKKLQCILTSLSAPRKAQDLVGFVVG